MLRNPHAPWHRVHFATQSGHAPHRSSAGVGHVLLLHRRLRLRSVNRVSPRASRSSKRLAMVHWRYDHAGRTDSDLCSSLGQTQVVCGILTPAPVHRRLLAGRPKLGKPQLLSTLAYPTHVFSLGCAPDCRGRKGTLCVWFVGSNGHWTWQKVFVTFKEEKRGAEAGESLTSRTPKLMYTYEQTLEYYLITNCLLAPVVSEVVNIIDRILAFMISRCVPPLPHASLPARSTERL